MSSPNLLEKHLAELKKNLTNEEITPSDEKVIKEFISFLEELQQLRKENSTYASLLEKIKFKLDTELITEKDVEHLKWILPEIFDGRIIG